MHKSIPRSWKVSLLPNGEVLTCYPSLILAGSWRQKPCAQMCWSSVHPCVPQIGVWEWFFATRRSFLFQSPFELLPLSVVDLHRPHRRPLITLNMSPDPGDNTVLVSSSRSSQKQRRCWRSTHPCLFVTEKDVFFPRERNPEEKSLLPLLHCRGQRETVQLWILMVRENIHLSLWVVSRTD